MLRNITNVSNAQVTLTDFFNKVVAAGETFDGLAFGEDVLRSSLSVQVALLQNQLKINDGFTDFVGQAAVDLLRGYATQVTRDGKPITTSSDRPIGFYRCFTGKGDDIVSTPKRIGEGAEIRMTAEPGTSVSVDVHFVDDVYIRDGEITYLGAGFDSHLTAVVICPAGVPFPSPTHTGTLDLVPAGFVANNTGTGAFMTVGAEVTLFRFINAMALVGSNKSMVQSPEPFLLNTPYFMRFTTTADATLVDPVKAVVTMGLYRKKTL